MVASNLIPNVRRKLSVLKMFGQNFDPILNHYFCRFVFDDSYLLVYLFLRRLRMLCSLCQN